MTGEYVPQDPEGFLPGPAMMQEAFPPLPICWPTLTITEQRERLEALSDWLRWLTTTYALDHRTVPTCWPEHPALIEELSALRTAWLTAYATTSPGNAPLDWHCHFAASRQRLTEWVSKSGCRPSEHRSSIGT